MPRLACAELSNYVAAVEPAHVYPSPTSPSLTAKVKCRFAVRRLSAI